ncbi:hypothetical protein HZH68_002404 [Vespula germanica]|uniref:Uncharacterized protein n=2 Tax=Vespidae TaxID=7438 RepID=A0A834NM96_VESGE|nr:hypothetical protein HZH68_002404 [Vespula germanica]
MSLICGMILNLPRNINQFVVLFHLVLQGTNSIMQEILLAAFSVISSLLIVFGLVLLGWYLVWKFFLSRFRFVRELLGGMSESSSVNDLKNGRSRIKKVRRD